MGVRDVRGDAARSRFIGNVVVEAAGFGTLIGFENHSARTYLGAGVLPLGRVVAGSGNNGADATEGARQRNAVGSYLHGSLLPKNPALADWLISVALERRGDDPSLNA